MKICAPAIRFSLYIIRKIEKRFAHYSYHTGDKRFLYDIPYTLPYENERRFSYFKAKEHTRKNKLLIDIHGGGYLMGNRRNNYAFAEIFCNAGFDVALPDYRLVDYSRARNVKSEIEDLLLFLNFLSSHLEKYGKIKDVYLLGDSAGGHFALFIAEILSSPSLKEKWGIKDLSLPLRGVLLNCPVYDFLALFSDFGFTKAALRLLFGFSMVDAPYFKTFSPKEFLDLISFPVFVSSAKRDFLSSHAKKLHADLKRFQKEHRFVFVSEKGRGLTHVHNLLHPDLAASKKVNEAMIKFMNEY